MGVKRHCSLVSFSICEPLLKRADGPASPLLCRGRASHVARPRVDLRSQRDPHPDQALTRH